MTMCSAIESIDSKLISVCLINYYCLLPTYIYLFMEALNAQPFSLECTKVKRLILNNFDLCTVFYHFYKVQQKFPHPYTFSCI